MSSICVKGPRSVIAKDIILPPSVEIIDNTQHITNLTEPINLCIELQIKKNHGYHIKTLNNSQGGSYPIDAVFIPVRNANYSIHYLTNIIKTRRGSFLQDTLYTYLEIKRVYSIIKIIFLIYNSV